MKIITSTQNQYIKELKLLKIKKGRREGRFLCEGEKCAMEALAYADTESLIVSDESSPAALLAVQKGVELYLVSDAVMESISDTRSQQGTIAVVKRQLHTLPSPAGLFIALEDVSDPQNVGTIIRTADAVGASCVLLSSLSADYTSPKAVRAAMGSVFHLPIVVCDDLGNTLTELKKAGMHIIGAHLRGKEQLEKTDNAVVIIGNEARGMSDLASSLCDSLYRIPIKGRAESLNAAVAAGIIIYKMLE